MKPERKQKNTPEESLRRACEEGMGLDLNYSEVRDRLDTTEIARVGKVRKAAKTAKAATPAPSAPSPRRAVPAILLVLAVLILTPALAVGSFLIARSTMDPLPPAETVDSMPPLGTNPDQSFTPNGSVTVTPRPITPNASGEAWNNLFDLSESYTTDNALFLRAEHLDPAMTDGTLPAVLTVNNLAEWQQICSDPTLDVTKIKVDSEDVPGDFFVNHSLLVIVTEGRSGSIRYRLEETYLPIGKLHRSWELVAEVPLALTMDIVHWCVLIPVSKAEAQMPVVLSMRDEPAEETTETNPGEIVTPLILGAEALEALRDTSFDLDGSYATPNDLYDPNRSLDAERHVLFLRTDHLPAEIADAEQPTMLWVEELDLWQDLFPSLSSHINDSYSVLDTALCGYNSQFFDDHSLLILFTEGRSGSVRYRLEDTSANRESVNVTLTAGVPAANTMDIAYWCVMVPVAKPKSGETNRPVYLKTHEVAMDSLEDFASPSPEAYRGLWFYGYSDGSYERDGYLYGRLANVLELWQTWDYPRTEIFTSYEDWQARYSGCYTKHMRKTFYEGLCAINEDFFAQKSLLVVYLEEGSGSIHHRVDGVTTEDGVLNVKITSLNAGGSDDMGQWAILIPIDKKLDSLPVELELGEQLCTWEEYEALPELQDRDVLEE